MSQKEVTKVRKQMEKSRKRAEVGPTGWKDNGFQRKIELTSPKNNSGCTAHMVPTRLLTLRFLRLPPFSPIPRGKLNPLTISIRKLIFQPCPWGYGWPTPHHGVVAKNRRNISPGAQVVRELYL